MPTRIITPAAGQNARCADCPCEGEDCASCQCGGCSCHSAEFCETLTLHESFDASAISCACANIAYDTSFLGYTVETVSVQAELPCGGCCPIDVYRVTLTGAIPYIIDVGPVTSGCGGSVRLSMVGSVMVNEPIGFVCGDTEPDLNELTCGSVTPCIHTTVSDCGCTGRANITVEGRFEFSDLPTCQ